TLIVCPGYVKTNFQKNAAYGQPPDKIQKSKRFAITPETCARSIRHGVERDSRTIVTPRAGWLFVLAMRLFPSLVEGRMGSMNLRLKLTPGIYVVGFMGAGKSTVGRHLAHRLGWSFFDTDHEIEAAEKTTIAEIFSTRGEPEFRRIESEILRHHVQWIERGRP